MESKPKQKSSHAFKIILIVMLLASFVIYGIMEYLSENSFSGSNSNENVFTETDTTVTYDAASKADFFAVASKQSLSQDGFFYATKDGIKYVPLSGADLMSSTYNLTNPVLTGEGGIAAVLEKNGNNAYVYNVNGEMYQVITEYPILNYSVNQAGYLSLIMKKGDDYFMTVYNNKGNIQAKGDLIYKNLVPIASDVSNDGRIHAICFLDINQAEVNSFVNFYYLNESEAMDYKQNDGLFASSGDNQGQIIGTIKFMDKNRLITVSDKQINSYEPENKQSKKIIEPINNKIDAVSFEESSCFAVALGEGIINKDSERPGSVKFYDLNLNQIGSFEANGEVTYLSSGFGSTIIGTNRNYTAVSNKGSVIWKHNVVQDIKKMLFIGKTSQILMAGTNEASIIRISKEKSSNKKNNQEEPGNDTEILPDNNE